MSLIEREGRAERLQELMREHELGQLVVGDLVRPGDTTPEAMVNSCWLTGFTGSGGIALVGHERNVLITDVRYAERAEREVGDAFRRIVAASSIRLLPQLVAQLSGRVGYDPATTSVANLRVLEEMLLAAGSTADLVPVEGLVERLRRVKDPGECAAMGEAARIVDQAFEQVVLDGLIGRTEREVAAASEERVRALGAEPLLPTLLAAGENTSQPHAAPSDRVIGPDELVVLDMGALVEGYHSECTRTLATGDVGDERRELYELARVAQVAALAIIGPGTTVAEADEAARACVRSAGYLEYYSSSLGHGVGLAMHEAPRMWPEGTDVLCEGNVVSVEPGIFLPGRMGVRIEDLVLITADGFRKLNAVPSALRVTA